MTDSNDTFVVRIQGGEGQYEVGGSVVDRLNELDAQAAQAVRDADEAGLDALLTEMADLVRAEGTKLPDDYLGTSDIQVPSDHTTLEEAQSYFVEGHDGFIPDHPVHTG